VRQCSGALAFVVSPNFLVRILGAHGKRDSAARGELGSHDRFARAARFDEVVEDTVCDGFVECALVSVRRKIKFERLALDAETVRHVVDIDPCEIRLACDRANRSEIIRFKMNPVIPARGWIRKSLQTRFSG